MKKTYSMSLTNANDDALMFTVISDFDVFRDGNKWLDCVAAAANEIGVPASDLDHESHRLFWKDVKSGQRGEVNFAAMDYMADRMDMLAVFA